MKSLSLWKFCFSLNLYLGINNPSIQNGWHLLRPWIAVRRKVYSFILGSVVGHLTKCQSTSTYWWLSFWEQEKRKYYFSHHRVRKLAYKGEVHLSLFFCRGRMGLTWLKPDMLRYVSPSEMVTYCCFFSQGTETGTFTAKLVGHQCNKTWEWYLF